jgi:L-alanine-DL-glutamate epimerase-like enolase superfamily enzyme
MAPAPGDDGRVTLPDAPGLGIGPVLLRLAAHIVSP